MKQDPNFWLGQDVVVEIDRPLGSKHPNPNFETIYSINYGFIPGTLSPVDNEEVDAYVIGPTDPIKNFQGKVLAVIVREDDEIKLVVTDGTSYSRDEIAKITNFQEKYFRSEIVL